MEYIFKEKIIRPGLRVQNVYPKAVLVADPSQEICSIYSKHLSDADFIAQSCNKYSTLSHTLKEFDPHLLLLTLAPLKQKIEFTIKQIMGSHPFMCIITLSDKETDVDPRKLLGLGVVGHMNKSFSRPQDVVALAQHVLQ